jgi:hypothetical protein
MRFMVAGRKRWGAGGLFRGLWGCGGGVFWGQDGQDFGGLTEWEGRGEMVGRAGDEVEVAIVWALRAGF